MSAPAVVDIHAHALPPDGFAAISAAYPDTVPRRVVSESGSVLVYPGGRRSGRLPPGMFDPPARLADMKQQGVTHQVLSAPPITFFYSAPAAACRDLARYQNDALLDAAAGHPGQLSMLAALPLPDTAASVAEIARIAGNRAVRGVAIGSCVPGDDLAAARFEPLWEALTDADLGVLIHPGDVAGQERMREHFLRNLVGNPVETTLAAAHLVFGGVLDRHPTLRVCLVHGGGFVPYQIGRWDHGWRSRAEVGADLVAAPSTYLSRFFFDTIVHDGPALRFLGQQVGWGGVVLGSDYPFDMGVDRPVHAVDDAGVGGSWRDAVLGGNSVRFLRP